MNNKLYNLPGGKLKKNKRSEGKLYANAIITFILVVH